MSTDSATAPVEMSRIKNLCFALLTLTVLALKELTSVLDAPTMSTEPSAISSIDNSTPLSGRYSDVSAETSK